VEFVRGMDGRSVAFQSFHDDTMQELISCVVDANIDSLRLPRTRTTYSFWRLVKNFESRGVDGTRKNPTRPTKIVKHPSC